MSHDIIKADKTLEAINQALEADQGGRFRKLLRENIVLVEDAYRGEEDPFRSHLGASLLGADCARYIWLNWRWARRVKVPGRIVRLFNRGHLEEARFASLLQLIGCTLWQFDRNGKQFRIPGYKGHGGGGLDGVVEGIPDIPNEPVLTEFKTHGKKSFDKMKKEGVRGSKLQHFVQMQRYMGHYGLRWALYLAVQKDNDEIWAELVEYDPEVYSRFGDRERMLIDSPEPPARIHHSPGWYQCKFCDFHAICHGDDLPEVNCRTCRWSTPVEDGSWICEAPYQGTPNGPLTKKQQLAGCSRYEGIPSIKGK